MAIIKKYRAIIMVPMVYTTTALNVRQAKHKFQKLIDEKKIRVECNEHEHPLEPRIHLVELDLPIIRKGAAVL